jgi:ribosomal protein L31E
VSEREKQIEAVIIQKKLNFKIWVKTRKLHTTGVT